MTMDYFRQYLIVGGMPQAVEAYVSERDFDRVKRDILELYRADIVKHAEGYEMKVEQIFDDIPAQLQKHDTRFKLSSLKKDARLRDYEDALFWLSDAMIVNVCYIQLHCPQYRSKTQYGPHDTKMLYGRYRSADQPLF